MSGTRVSIFLPSLAGGGAERSITVIANGLAGLGVRVSLVLGSARGPYLDLVHPAVEVVDLGAPSMWRALPRLVRILPEITGPTFGLYFIYPSDLRRSKRVAAFRDFLTTETEPLRKMSMR